MQLNWETVSMGTGFIRDQARALAYARERIAHLLPTFNATRFTCCPAPEQGGNP